MRRGITLIEVLISMFVLLVGLIGVFSLLPVAKSYMADGVKYDAVSSVGQRAMHDLEVRTELLDPSNWFAPQGPASFLPSPNGAFQEVCPATQTIGGVTYSGAYNYNWTANSTIATIPAAPFILDPMACAYPDNLSANANPGGGGAGQISATGSYAPTFFPPSAYSLDGVGNPGSPALARVTLPMKGGIYSPPSSPLVRFCKPMTLSQASRIFQSSDDMLFSRPDDPTQRPTVAPSPSTSQGDYSWFAVIDNVQRPWNPGPDGVWGSAGDDNGDNVPDDIGEAGWPLSDDIALWKLSGGQLWHVSVAVVHKRNLQLISQAAGDIPPERMCYCDFLSAPVGVGGAVATNAGLGGGDCVLSIGSSQAPSGDWLNVKQNQWIMLSAWPVMQNFTTGAQKQGQLPMVQWFRISAVGDVVQTAAGWQRTVTLVGPDWNPYKFMDAIGHPPVTGLQFVNYQTAYATIVDGVVGVFESTLEQGE